MSDHAILRRECTEVDDLTSRLRGMVATAVPIRKGRYAGALSTIDLGDITLQVVRSTPMLILGASAEGSAGFVQVTEGSRHARWDGRAIEAGEIALCDAGRQHGAIYPDDFACTILSFPATRANGALTLPTDLGLPPDGLHSDVRAESDARSALAAIAQEVEQAAADTRSVLCGTEARRSLRATVLSAARGLLGPADAKDGPRTGDRRMRQRLVREADAYLRANPARHIYTDDLCAALGTSATRLHQAFSANFGISPHRYLKLRRMGMVRAALLSRSGPWRSVKAAALSHGFWHLGQFAGDYRALYGEAPSETLARAWPANG